MTMVAYEMTIPFKILSIIGEIPLMELQRAKGLIAKTINKQIREIRHITANHRTKRTILIVSSICQQNS